MRQTRAVTGELSPCVVRDCCLHPRKSQGLAETDAGAAMKKLFDEDQKQTETDGSSEGD